MFFFFFFIVLLAWTHDVGSFHQTFGAGGELVGRTGDHQWYLGRLGRNGGDDDCVFAAPLGRTLKTMQKRTSRKMEEEEEGTLSEEKAIVVAADRATGGGGAAVVDESGGVDASGGASAADGAAHGAAADGTADGGDSIEWFPVEMKQATGVSVR